jgi:hypothetical protein
LARSSPRCSPEWEKFRHRFYRKGDFPYSVKIEESRRSAMALELYSLTMVSRAALQKYACAPISCTLPKLTRVDDDSSCIAP